MFKNILVPLDGSKDSFKALAYAKEMAQMFSATLFVTTIIDPSVAIPAGVPSVGGIVPVQVELDVREEAAHVIDEAKKELAGTNILVKYTIVSGTVNDEIATNLPEKEEIDLIVLGKSGKSALEKLIVGSVTKYVVQHAEVPVLVTEAASE